MVNILQQPEKDELDLKEAAHLCNVKILASVEKVVTFVYHSTSTILEPVADVKDKMEVIEFFLD